MLCTFVVDKGSSRFVSIRLHWRFDGVALVLLLSPATFDVQKASSVLTLRQPLHSKAMVEDI